MSGRSDFLKLNSIKYLMFIFALVLMATCKKEISGSTINKSNVSKSNDYIIINGIKHQLNYSLCYKFDTGFYIELDSVSADSINQPIYFSYNGIQKIGTGTYNTIVQNTATNYQMSFSAQLLIPIGYAYVIDNAHIIGSLTISDITSNSISGTFEGSMEYVVPVNGPTTSSPINTCNFSGVFNNDSLASH
jgi:hypothetical protein